MTIRHLLLDRDGVLNIEGPTGWVTDPTAFRWQPGALPALVALCQGRRVSVITNQSVIGRGLASRSQIDAVHAHLQDQLQAAGGRIERFYVCPHAPDTGCSCRKPAPGMLLQAIADSGIPATDSLFVGDSSTDLAAGESAGIRTLLVQTGKGKATQATTGVIGLRDLAAVAELLGAPLEF